MLNRVKSIKTDKNTHRIARNTQKNIKKKEEQINRWPSVSVAFVRAFAPTNSSIK